MYLFLGMHAHIDSLAFNLFGFSSKYQRLKELLKAFRHSRLIMSLLIEV